MGIVASDKWWTINTVGILLVKGQFFLLAAQVFYQLSYISAYQKTCKMAPVVLMVREGIRL